MTASQDYLLGVNQTELERLEFQHGVWRQVTDKFLDRLKIAKGWKCLDVGAGPGFVAMDLRDRVGDSGEITSLEPSEFYLEWFRKECETRGWTNTRYILGSAETAELPRGHYDFIFARWVIGFVPDPEKFIVQLLRALRPGGIIAIEDYVYPALKFYPTGGPFDGMCDAVRAYWRAGGGDPDIASRIPSFFRKYGVNLTDYTPNVLAGGPTSGIVEWAHRFFSTHVDAMADRGVITREQGKAMFADWLAHRENPDAMFFSPTVVDVAGVLT